MLDKLNDHLKVSSAKLDKIMSLLVAFAYNSKFKLKWCLKFIQHALFSLLLRSLNAKVCKFKLFKSLINCKFLSQT